MAHAPIRFPHCLTRNGPIYTDTNRPVDPPPPPQLLVFAFRDLVKEFCSSEAHDRVEISTSNLMSNLHKLEASCPELANATQASLDPACPQCGVAHRRLRRRVTWSRALPPAPQAKRERISRLTRLEDTVKQQLAEQAARAPPKTKQQKLEKQMELCLKVCDYARARLSRDALQRCRLTRGACSNALRRAGGVRGRGAHHPRAALRRGAA